MCASSSTLTVILRSSNAHTAIITVVAYFDLLIFNIKI